MAGQVCRQIIDTSGKIIGFEVVGHIVNGVDIYAIDNNDTSKKPRKKKSE